MKKLRLFTPGPVMIPAEVQLEIAQPIDHHRTAGYRAMLKELTGLLQYVFQTNATCLTFTGSGSSGAEAAIVGCCPPGHKALVVRNGKFSERWAKVCAAFGIQLHRKTQHGRKLLRPTPRLVETDNYFYGVPHTSSQSES